MTSDLLRRVEVLEARMAPVVTAIFFRDQQHNWEPNQYPYQIALHACL